MAYHLKFLHTVVVADVSGRYWSVGSDGLISCDSVDPIPFRFEFAEQSKFAIKAPNGMYIKGEQNGQFSAKSSEISKAALWEY